MKELFVKLQWLIGIFLIQFILINSVSSKDTSAVQFSPAQKQSKVNMVLEGRWNHGPSFASVAARDYMFYGSSGRVVAVKVKKDVSGKAIQWDKVSSLQLDGVIRDMLIHENTLFIAGGSGALRLVNIEDPTNMKALGTYSLRGQIRGLSYSDNKIFIAAGWNGMEVIDVSDKNNPSKITEIKAGYALDVVVSDKTAYIAGGKKGLFIIDISAVESPKLLSHFEIPGSSAGLTFRDELVYLVNMDDDFPSMSIIDVSNKTEPKNLANQKLKYGAERVRLVGNHAYIAGVSNDAGLIIVDIEDPSSPKEVGSWWHPTCSESVFVADKVAYLAHGDQGLDILDVSEPSKPTVLKKFETAGHVRNLEPRGDFTFLANGYNGLKIVDSSNKSEPKTISQIQTYRALDVDVLGNYAHVADDWAGYKLIDISDIKSPKLIAELDTPGYAEDVFATEKLAYVASGEGGLRIIYLKDGNKPQEIGAVELENGYANEVIVRGRYAYLAAGKDGLVVINVSNPSSPIVESIYKSGHKRFDALGVALKGDLAYVSSGYAGVNIIDISKPKSLKEVGYFKSKRSAKHLTIDNDIAYLVDLENIRVLDISDPTNPIDVNEHPLPARSAKVHVQNGNVYVAGMEAGMVIFDAQ